MEQIWRESHFICNMNDHVSDARYYSTERQLEVATE